MDFERVPDVQFQDPGVIFRYLVLRFRSGDQEKTLVRGINYRPYEPETAQRIINWTWDELEAAGFREGRDELGLEGGGTLSVNPYYETATLFGAASVGPEADRAATASMLEKAFPGHKVEWFPPEEEKPKKPVKKPPPKAVEADSGDDDAEAEA